MSNSVQCPTCGKFMRLRTSKSGNKFYGCSQFPRCRGTMPFNKGASAKNWDNFKPSKYQADFKDWLLNSEGNGVVEAVAGSGKTTTLLWCLSLLQKGVRVLFLAFNSHIVRELQSKIPNGIQCSTIHSLGLQSITQDNGKPEIVASKLRDTIKDVTSKLKFENSKLKNIRNVIIKVVSLAKSVRIDFEGKHALVNLYNLISKYNIEVDPTVCPENDILPYIKKVMVQTRQERSIIDYDDMLDHCLVYDIAMPKYDFVFVDEAQDLNQCQMDLLPKLSHKSTRIICVGDRYQSIYGFRGADTQAIPNLINNLESTVLPLSICYRCPSKHIDLVKREFPEINIEASDKAKKGEINYISDFELASVAQEKDLVLCRTNAPLVINCYECLKLGKKASIKGRDIGAGLIALIEKLEASDISDLLQKLSIYRMEQVRILSEQEKEILALEVSDKCECIDALASEADSLNQLRQNIKELFQDSTQGIVFSTVHKAKGLESDRVFILKPELMPFPKAKEGEEMQQERNIKYVAFTRSKSVLTFVQD